MDVSDGCVGCEKPRGDWLEYEPIIETKAGGRYAGDGTKSASNWANGGPLAHRNLVLDSDQGSQYAATATREWLDTWQIGQSMSRHGNCWDNALIESYFATLKKELVHREHYQSPERAKTSLFFSIEVF